MMREALLAVVTGTLVLIGVGCGAEPAPAPLDPELALQEAQQYDHFQATVRLFESRGQAPDLSAATIEVVEGSEQETLLRIPLAGEAVSELHVRFTGEGKPEVSSREPQLVDQDEPSTLAACGAYDWQGACNQGPYSSTTQICSTGRPIYYYRRYTRIFYTGGRRIYYEYTWYDCNWIAQSTICNSTCTI